MRSFVCGIGFALASSAAVAAAQTAPDFSALRAGVGDEIVVTSAEGVEIGGRITKISPSALSIDGYAFTPADAIKIERPGDSLWNGAAIGYGVGALFGATIGAEACLHESTWRCVNSGGITYGLLGALIDYAHKGRRTIYKSPSGAPRKAMRLVPDIGPERKGVAVALAF
jgi:hypothetical protein